MVSVQEFFCHYLRLHELEKIPFLNSHMSHFIDLIVQLQPNQPTLKVFDIIILLVQMKIHQVCLLPPFSTPYIWLLSS